ncbi:hypothetical protein E1B28_009812 [Marasmius oreades]|uniref:Cytochrome P450 n=1 Tax=Marasmius oreades TaxID=181124 RepID=A0A9P7RW20_9AGAR|nr:uncharacterized protein E1B28_009812 [Marasmius oreades]KAG7090720.1 hypothetical protein E1B28_009812 [Marasmius oreades]
MFLFVAPFVLLLVLALIWAVKFFLIQPVFDPLRNLPGPEASLFTSHAVNVVDPQRSVIYNRKYREDYGKTFKVHGFGGYDLRLMSFDVRTITYILNSPTYEKPKISRGLLATFLGRGIFTMEGAEHAFQRKIIAPAFATQSIKELMPIFFHEAQSLRDKWEELVLPSKSTSDAPGHTLLDVSHWAARSTFDCFGLACLDYNFRAVQGETGELYTAFRTVFDLVNEKKVLRLVFPILDRIWPDRIAREIKKHLAVIYRTGQEVVDRKREEIQDEKYKSKDFLSLLIKSNLSTDSNKRLTDSDLLDQITAFLFAGSDSTGLSISFCLLYLAEHPEYQTRLRDEIASATTNHDIAAGDYPPIDSYPFLNAVVRETLRLYPSVHSTIRVATKDDVIPVSHPVVMQDGTVIPAGGSFPIRKGSAIHIPIEGLNYSQDIWGPGSLKFRPERWMSDTESPSFPGLSNVMTFSLGGHACPGWRFALAEMKVFLIIVLPRFRFLPVENQVIRRFNGILTRPFVKGRAKEGFQLPLRLERLES